jgi:hypothetical protein
MIVSPASFFAWFDVVRALSVRRTADDPTDPFTQGDSDKLEKLSTILLVDLFSPSPTVKHEQTRIRLIAELQFLVPDIFTQFIDNKLSAFDNKRTVIKPR